MRLRLLALLPVLLLLALWATSYIQFGSLIVHTRRDHGRIGYNWGRICIWWVLDYEFEAPPVQVASEEGSKWWVGWLDRHSRWRIAGFARGQDGPGSEFLTVPFWALIPPAMGLSVLLWRRVSRRLSTSRGFLVKSIDEP